MQRGGGGRVLNLRKVVSAKWRSRRWCIIKSSSFECLGSDNSGITLPRERTKNGEDGDRLPRESKKKKKKRKENDNGKASVIGLTGLIFFYAWSCPPFLSIYIFCLDYPALWSSILHLQHVFFFFDAHNFLNLDSLVEMRKQWSNESFIDWFSAGSIDQTEVSCTSACRYAWKF